MDQNETFPVQQFYEALMSSSGLQQKLQVIIKQIKKKNMEMIYQSIVHIHQILNSKLQPPLMKFNALNCTKILFSSCEYSLILLIQVYLLPIIFQIAVFKATKKSEQGLSLYFTERGAQPTKQVKRLGSNYVNLAIQFVYATSQIKMYRILENDELEQESNFKKISKALKMRGVSEVTNYKFYNMSQIQQTRKIYIDKLSVFNPQNFIDYMTDKIFNQVANGRQLQLDSKRLIMFGDVYIISSLVNIIQEQLNQINGNFQGKRKTLVLFFQLVRFGYAQAILLLNSSQFLNSISYQISKVNGDKDMDQGKLIYQKIQDSHKSKKSFYLQFLKCVQTWSHAIPLNQNNEESDSKKIYDYLKYEKKFKFPENSNVHRYKSQLDIYLRQNSERNEKVIQIIQKRENISSKSKYKISSLKDESNIKGPRKILEFEQLQQIIVDTMKILEVVGFSEKRFEKQMRKLIEFRENWHKNIELVKKNNANEKDEPFNIDILVSEGQIVYQQIVGLQKIHKQFKEKRVSFKETQQKINSFLNLLQEENYSNSQISVSAKSKNTHLTNRRDLRSKISQRVRNQKSFSDHSKHSYVSQNKPKSNTKPYPNKSSNSNNQITLSTNLQTNLHNPNMTISANFSPKTVQKISNDLVNDTFSINNYDKQIKNDILSNKKKQYIVFKDQEKKQQQINFKNKIIEPVTAQFIHLTSQKQNKNVNKINQNIKNQTINTKNDKKQIQKIKKQIFLDSFESETDFIKRLEEQKQKNSLKLNTSSQAQIFSSNIYGKQNVNAKTYFKQGKKQIEPKGAALKRILSNEKIQFNKNASSESEQQQFKAIKLQQNNENKKISKYISFNNGNFSGYFNEQSIQQYGFGQNKELTKRKQKIINDSRNQTLTSQQLKKMQIQTAKNKLKNIDKISSSKQISKIQLVEKEGLQIQNFDDFQLVNLKQKQEQKQKEILQLKLQQPSLSEVSRVDLTQKIKEQDSFQMIESYYKTKQIEEDKFSKKRQGIDLNFCQIVQVRKQVIHDRDNCISPIYHHEDQTRRGRMKKLFDNLDFKNSSKKKDLMEVLSQRSTKKCIEHYLIQKQKNKLIQNLNLRIKKLQNQQKTIKSKLSRKDEELKSISYKNYSQRNKIKFANQNSNQISLQASSRGDANSLRDNDTTSFPNLLYYNNTVKLNQLNSQNQLSVKLEQQKIDASTYQPYLQELNNNSLKKNCLKNKSLIFVSQEVQIGCMSIRKDKIINFTLFITPKLFSISNLSISFNKDQNLLFNAFPESLYSIKAKKQQTINLKITIQNIPFRMPKIHLRYQMQMNSSKNYNNNQSKYNSQIQFILPFTFYKLCTFQQINSNNFYQMFFSEDVGQSTIKISDKFRLNTKIFKDQKIKQYFPYLRVVKRKQSGNNKPLQFYGFEINYNGNIFLMMIKIEDSKYGRIEGKNMTGQIKNEKWMQFFMITLKKLLSN